MTLAELNKHITDALTPSLGHNEAKATARLLLEDDLRVTPTMLALRGERVLEPETVSRFERFIARINAGEPPQYVTGSARFMGMDLKVTPATLIPRPETAELVDLIVDRSGGKADSQVCDLGTGSGCIAIALARALPFAKVVAIDNSPEALEVARENGKRLSGGVTFVRADILIDLPRPSAPYDIIVSNPPYIADSEKAGIEARVKEHEPASALFVPDSDPLRFYKAIADYANDALAQSGKMYFEINPMFADRLVSMMASKGFSCEVLRDSFGKNRFAVCARN